MRNVSKQIFLNAITCPTLGWLMRTGETIPIPSVADRLRMEQGTEIGKRARTLYPDGILVDEKDGVSAIDKTRSLIDDPVTSIMFEGSFRIDGYSTKADILKRKNDGWHLVEVKSSVNDKEEFIDDIAYTAMVILRCGINISAASLWLVSKDFRLGMNNEKLFVKIDHTPEVLGRIRDFQPLWKEIEEVTRSTEEPEPELRFDCRKCEIFQECLGKGVENHIFELPRLSSSKFQELKNSGVLRIDNIPNNFPLTENQKIVKDSVQSKKAFIASKLKNELESISWPAYYLDFETVMTALPLYEGIAPFTQIPIQYSIHKCKSPGNILGHFEYLADPKKDCRHELAESLINHLKEEGSIVVYTNFERNIINGLRKEYPALSSRLEALLDRLVDLEAIIKKNYYHPNFHGSISIKTTLPVLVPEMSYDGLEIAEGDTASAEFAFCALGKYDKQEVEAVKRRLLLYCKQDTLAMVELHEHLAGLI